LMRSLKEGVGSAQTSFSQNNKLLRRTKEVLHARDYTRSGCPLGQPAAATWVVRYRWAARRTWPVWDIWVRDSADAVLDPSDCIVISIITRSSFRMIAFITASSQRMSSSLAAIRTTTATAIGWSVGPL